MNMNVCLVTTTIWIWWATIIESAAWVSSSSSVAEGRLLFDRVEFRVLACTKETYSTFIESLRGGLSLEETNRYGIPLMRAPDPSGSEFNVLLVELFDWDDESITLVVNLTNAYVIAYQAQNRSYLLQDTPNNQFFGSNPHRLSFDGSYTELQRVAGERRENINLGITELAQAILTLNYWTPSQEERSVARALIVLIQMVSEAARFRQIEQRVTRNIVDEHNPPRYDSFRPGAGMISLQTNWETLSRSVLESSDGVLQPPVTLQTSDYGTIDIGTVNRAKLIGLALLLYTCKARQSQALFSPYDFSVLSTSLDLDVVRSMLDITAYDICAHPEPTVRISGRDGYCMEVRGGHYDNGNPISLGSCNEDEDVKQLWTFKRGGTIQSNGKCLTGYGHSVGHYVMINDCSSAVIGASTLWNLQHGSLINRLSGLAISAESGNIGTTLTMRVHLNASKQAWHPSNNTKSFLTSIIGLNDLCMQRKCQTNVGLAACNDNNVDQKWIFYGDGSIRPLVDPSYCVTCQSHAEGSRIVVLSCNFGGASQRWMFTSRGAIYNLHNGFVMDVKDANPSLQEIIIYRSNGNPNQKWFTTL